MMYNSKNDNQIAPTFIAVGILSIIGLITCIYFLLKGLFWLFNFLF